MFCCGAFSKKDATVILSPHETFVSAEVFFPLRRIRFFRIAECASGILPLDTVFIILSSLLPASSCDAVKSVKSMRRL